MGIIKGILIYKYARRRTAKLRDRQDACEQEAIVRATLDGDWLDLVCDYCGRTNEEHLDDTEPCN